MTGRSQGPDLSGLKIGEHARRDPTRRGWYVLAAGLAAVLFSVGLVFWLREPTTVVDVATVRADKGGRPALLNASGYVTPRRRATVAAKITARVNEIFAEEGMQVEPGQVLARLDDADARARLASAKADREATAATLGDLRVNLANAERELARQEELFKRGLVAEQARDQARTTADSLKARITLAREQVGAAEARVQVAQQDLDNCIVRAPFAGVVVSKDAQRGEMVSPISAGGGFTRTGIATIVDMSSLDAYPDWQVPAKVRTVIPTADRQKATVKVRVTFDRLDPRILPDMGVKVTFLGDEPSAPAAGGGRVLVPRAALREEGGTAAVFVYREGRVERRAVRLGQARGNEHEVIAGLTDGEQIVTTGVGELRDGQTARVKR
jgi:multidrug efflux pump subunit AcrA (membrane-fusion protein)